MSDSSMWVIIAVVLVILFFVVVIVGVGLAIFFIMRKKKKDQLAQAGAAAPELADYSTPALSQPEPEPVASEYESTPLVVEEAAVTTDQPPSLIPDPLEESAPTDFDPSRTVAITRENTVTISYGTIKFVSGVLSGQEFEVAPEGEYIGREASMAQIIVSDPRISKRHLWIGVRDGVVKVEDQNSRNGTFLNDPRSERITEAALKSGDTVILGESDVARFEYQA